MPRLDYKILHCADLHLDSPLLGLEAYADAPRERIRDATRQALTNLVDFAIAEQVAVVLIAGDIYDGDFKDSRTGDFFIGRLKRLVDAGIRVVAISGNHDADNVVIKDQQTRWPARNDGVRATMLPTDRCGTDHFPELNLYVHGRGFAARETTENLIQNYPDRQAGSLNIGLLHTSADGRSTHGTYAPCSFDEMNSLGYDYWALGHVHTRRVEQRGDCWMVFPGNLQGRHIGEAGERGATLISVTNGRIVQEPEHHTLDVVRWTRIECDVTGAADLDDALAMVRAGLASAIGEAAPRLVAARLRVHGRTQAHAALASLADLRDRIMGEAVAAGGEDIFWLEKIKLDTAPVADRKPATEMERLLLEHIAAPPSEAALHGVSEWSRAMLEKYPPLRVQLGEDHPAAALIAGRLDAGLLDEARALLLARLDA